MVLNEKIIREYLSYYGAAIESWPEETRAAAYKARQHPSYAELFQEEEKFERLLNLCPAIVPAHANLAQRIITATHASNHSQKPQWLLYDLIISVRPAAVAATLVLGFAIGFSTMSTMPLDKKVVQSYSDDDGAAL